MRPRKVIKPETLTERENEVMLLRKSGYKAQQIAEILNVKESTIRTAIINARQKIAIGGVVTQ
jgi:DNA-binding CsgD family transcriptional regulator